MGGKKVRRIPSEKHRYHRVLATEAAGKVNRLYNSTARRALPAHLWSDDKLGEIGGKRVPLLKAIMRCEVGTKESKFRKKLLKETKKSLESDEVAVVDAGFTIREMLESDVDRFVLREAINCTARRNELPERKEKADHPNMVILCVRSLDAIGKATRGHNSRLVWSICL
ncbi:hypothetical protein KFU94_66650 [Chloroflexi bacterium TSY]|nr:hypothetical protein [Chloroflexi bacterium TSY]